MTSADEIAAQLTKLAQDTLDYPVPGPDGLDPLFAAASAALDHDVTWARPLLSPDYFPVADQSDFATKCERFLDEPEVRRQLADPDKMH